MKHKRMVARCPVCESEMMVTEVTCRSCETSVRGRFEIPELCRLPQELYDFLLVFVRNRGVIREVEKELGMSYPTVRSRLDAVIAALGFGVRRPDVDRDDIIRRLEAGELSPERAESLLRGEDAPDEPVEDGLEEPEDSAEAEG